MPRRQEVGEPRGEDELKLGLEKYEGGVHEDANALQQHLEELEAAEKSGAAGEQAAEEGKAVDIAKEGLAIDALKSFLTSN